MLLLLLLLSLSGTDAQFAEIASLATSFLGPALSGGGLAGLAGSAAGAAPAAAGALGQIGQLYQLAQGALQLTSTGVGVLNQATEGNWFPAALETAAKNQEQLRKGGGGLGGGGLGGGGLGGGLHGLMPLGPLGPLGGGGSAAKSGGSVGPEFGTSFPAPDIDDYNEEIDLKTTTTVKPKSPFDGSTEIEDRDLQKPRKTPPPPPTTTTTTTEATTEAVTLFPDEEEEESAPEPTEAPKKQIRIELPKEEEDYIDQITKEGATRVEVTNREKKEEDEILLPKPSPLVRPKAVKPIGGDGEIVPNLEKLVSALKEKSRLSEEEIRELVGQVETNFNKDQPPKIDFGAGVQNINEKKANNRKRILEASRRIEAVNHNGQSNGQSHRKLTTVILPSTTPPTPAPFVHSTTTFFITTSTPTPDEILNNRLQREIVAVENADKDLLYSRPYAHKFLTTSPPVATFVYPPQPQVQQQPQLQQRPQQTYYQAPPSFPIQQQPQQQQQQPYYQQYQQYYQQYPQYYQYQYQYQHPQLQYGQQLQQRYPQQQQVQYPQQQQYQPQPQPQQQQQQYPHQLQYQPQQYHTQQQIVMTGTASVAQPQRQQAPQVQQVQHVQQTVQQRPALQGDLRRERAVQTVSGQSSRIYTNQPNGAAFFVASKDAPIVRQHRQPVRAQAVKTSSRQVTIPPYRRTYARTALTLPLTTPSPVSGETRVARRTNHANQQH